MGTKICLLIFLSIVFNCNGRVPILGDILSGAHNVFGGITQGLNVGGQFGIGAKKPPPKQTEETIIVVVKEENQNPQPQQNYRPNQNGYGNNGYNDNGYGTGHNHNRPHQQYGNGYGNGNNGGNQPFGHGRPHNNDNNHYGNSGYGHQHGYGNAYGHQHGNGNGNGYGHQHGNGNGHHHGNKPNKYPNQDSYDGPNHHVQGIDDNYESDQGNSYYTNPPNHGYNRPNHGNNNNGYNKPNRPNQGNVFNKPNRPDQGFNDNGNQNQGNLNNNDQNQGNLDSNNGFTPNGNGQTYQPIPTGSSTEGQFTSKAPKETEKPDSDAPFFVHLNPNDTGSGADKTNTDPKRETSNTDAEDDNYDIDIRIKDE